MSPSWQWLVLVLCGICTVRQVAGSNILMLAGIASKSHLNFFEPIATTLTERGHKITLVSSYTPNKNVNITHVDVKMPIEKFMPNNFQNRHWRSALKLVGMIPPICAEALGREQLQQLNIDDYDLVFISLFLNDCFFSLLENIEVPVIGMVPNMMVTITHMVIGSVDFPSFVPLMGTVGQHPLTFMQRLQSVISNELYVLSATEYTLPLFGYECEKANLCREGISLEAIMKKTSLMFINSVQALEVPPRPMVPNVIHAGGLNCRPAQPLPQNIASWIEGSGESGVIYVSFGSVVKSADMPENFRKVLVNVFASLSQRILWKWDQETMDDLPANVMVSKWFPQQDILGHEKTKLFISHGGLFSTLEATYHGVPILGMPVFVDQCSNIDMVVHEGYGELAEWDDLNEEMFKGKIQQILTDVRYTEVVQKRSQLMRDQPISPQDAVGYWTEYIIRHKGAPHLRSPVVDMPRYKLYNMDVWAALLTVLVVALTLVGKIAVFVVGFCVARVRRSSGAGAKDDKKKKT